MIDRSAILERLDRERRSLAYHGEVSEATPHVRRLRADDNSHHCVIHSSLPDGNADAVIQQEIAHHRRLGVSFEWKLYGHDMPADLLDRLQTAGFRIGPREAVLALDLNDVHEWISAGNERQVIRIEQQNHIEIYRRVAEEIFGKDYTFTATELAGALRAGSDEHLGFIGFVDGEPASIGRLYTHADSAFGGLYGGGTLRRYRGKGVYRAIVAARAIAAMNAGARYLLVDALPTSQPILVRLGFEWLTDTWPCETDA
jgi:hypothetical protein